MMSKKSRAEVIAAVRERYWKANKAQKSRILDELVATTGYNRKYAIHLLRHEKRGTALKKPGRKKVYRGDVIKILEQIWEWSGYVCSKRLQPFMGEFIARLEACGELVLSEEHKAALLHRSAATIDRCLKDCRYRTKKHGLSTTKPGSLLKSQIPVRIFTPWDEEQVGFMEVDLVAHCGETTVGTYLHTLSATDIATGWTECIALPAKTQEETMKAIDLLRARLPFPLRGVDSDNGTEFINGLLYHYCFDHEITFTRCRSYHKNDQAHIEQKNWSVVRKAVGYDRFESPEMLELLRALYENMHLFVNFFQPVMKLVGKTVVGNKTHRIHDRAKTPYQRVLASDQVDPAIKEQLASVYNSLNPVELWKSIQAARARILKIDRLGPFWGNDEHYS